MGAGSRAQEGVLFVWLICPLVLTVGKCCWHKVGGGTDGCHLCSWSFSVQATGGLAAPSHVRGVRETL